MKAAEELIFEKLTQVNVYTLLVWTFAIWQCAKLLFRKAGGLGGKTFRLLEWYYRQKNACSLLLERISQIPDIQKQENRIADKINVLAQAMSEVQQTITENYKENKQEHLEFRESARKDQLAIYGDRLFQAYRFYKQRAAETGKMEWTCIERAGFYSIMDKYHEKGGDSYSHTTIEPYMRQFTVVDPENLHPDDIYSDR